MDAAIFAVYLVLSHPFAGSALFFLLGLVLVNVKGLRGALRLTGALLFVAAVGNLVLGHSLADDLVHSHGVSTTGVVTDAWQTADEYNDQNVFGFHVLLRLPTSNTVQEQFRTDSFNVYPHHNATSYPGVGDRFNARYLPGHPSAFVFEANPDGSFSASAHCDSLMDTLNASERKRQFDPANRAYRAEALRNLVPYMDAHCEDNDADRDHDEHELQELESRP